MACGLHSFESGTKLGYCMPRYLEVKTAKMRPAVFFVDWHALILKSLVTHSVEPNNPPKKIEKGTNWRLPNDGLQVGKPRRKMTEKERWFASWGGYSVYPKWRTPKYLCESHLSNDLTGRIQTKLCRQMDVLSICFKYVFKSSVAVKQNFYLLFVVSIVCNATCLILVANPFEYVDSIKIWPFCQFWVHLRQKPPEEYAAIMLYTSNAIYKDLNQALRDNNRSKVKKCLWFWKKRLVER